MGDETRLWGSWLANGGHRQFLNWYTVRMAQVCSFNRRFTEAEAWIEQLDSGLMDDSAVSIVAKIDVGCEPRMFWSLKLEVPAHDLAVRVLAEYCKASPDGSCLGIVELGRRRTWDGNLLGEVKEIFQGLRSNDDTSPWDEIEYWKDIFLSTPGNSVIEALAEAFRFHRSPSASPAVRKTLEDEIQIWYTMATQIETETCYPVRGIMGHLNDALLEEADDAVDEELKRTTRVWIDARNMWTCLKNRPWEDSLVASRIQGYLDDACAVLEVLQSGEQETNTAVAQLGNFLLSFLTYRLEEVLV